MTVDSRHDASSCDDIQVAIIEAKTTILKNNEATIAGKDGEQNKFLSLQHTNGT